MQKSKLLAIVGPTAVGKSRVALVLGERLNGEIVSADSMQVYREMDVGTAKSTKEEQARVKHHLIDIVDPNFEFSVAQYQSMAQKAIAEIQQKRKLPILIGGSGLYVRAVIDKLVFPATSGILGQIRRELEGGVKEKSLYQELVELDPEAAAKIDPQNKRRIIRALEVIKLTGRPFSEYQRRWSERESIYDLKIFGLLLPRTELYARIDSRVDKMIAEGFLEEVKCLVSEGYAAVLTSHQALGYKQILDYLNGLSSREETVDLIKKKTRQFAKRQLTWFRRDPRIKWIDVSGKSAGIVADEITGMIEDWGARCPLRVTRNSKRETREAKQ